MPAVIPAPILAPMIGSIAGGIVLSAQPFGGTFGMAVSSALFASFQDYKTVFIAVGALFLILLPLSIKTIRSEPAITEATGG